MNIDNAQRIFAESSADEPANLQPENSAADLEEQGELERQVRIVTKLSTKGGGEQAFVSPSVFDAAEGIREIVTEALTTGVLPDNRIRIKVYGTRGTKIAHLLAEVNVEVRPDKFALYV